MPPVLAIIFSVTLILLFGEIIPQALCARWGLTIGAYSAWAVWLLIGLTFPISWPISKLLDCVIGVDHQTYFKRAELKELVCDLLLQLLTAERLPCMKSVTFQ